MTRGKKIRVLLAEDHQIVREGLRRLVAGEPDMEVAGEAADGRAALREAERTKPDVVIMDLSMPALNGIEATRQIAGRPGAPRVICLSMHNEQKMVSAMLQAGAAGYLLKSCASRELAEAIRTVASGKTYHSPDVAGQVVDAFVRTRLAPKGSVFGQLTDREREIVQLIAEGPSAKEIAARLSISQKTVLAHRLHVLKKLSLHSDAELTRYALKQGLTEL